MTESRFWRLVWHREEVIRYWEYEYSKKPYRFSDINYKYILAKLLPELKKGSRILEIGFGTGRILTELYRAKFDVYGVEASPRALQLAVKRAPFLVDRLQLSQQSILPFGDESFDVVIAIEVLEHLPDEDFDLTLKEIYRILNHHGKLLLTVPYDDRPEERMLACPHCGAIFDREQHVRTFSISALKALLIRYGFKNIVFSPLKRSLQPFKLPLQVFAEKLKLIQPEKPLAWFIVAHKTVERSKNKAYPDTITY